MAYVLKDRIGEVSASTGTGDFTLAGAIDASYRAFSAKLANNDVFPGLIVAVDANGNPSGQWETGLFTWKTGNIVTRTTTLESSSSDAPVNFSAGVKYVYLTGIAGLNTVDADGNAFSFGSAPAGGAADLTSRLETIGRMAGSAPIYMSTISFAQAVNSTAPTTLAGAANRLELTPLIVGKEITVAKLGVFVTAGVAGSSVRLLVYDSDTNGRPKNRLYEQSVATAASNTIVQTPGSGLVLKPGVVYWVGIWFSSAPTLRAIPAGGSRQIGFNAFGTAFINCLRRDIAYNVVLNAPNPWVFTTNDLSSSAVYAVLIEPQ